MTEALKELRRAAELDLTGPKNEANQNELKKVLNKTVKATKVARGSAAVDQKESGVQVEDEEMIENKNKKQDDASDQESDKDNDEDDTVMDIDGFQKSKVTSYGVSDSEADIESSINADPEQTQH